MAHKRWAALQAPNTSPPDPQWYAAVSDSPLLDLIQWVSLHHAARARLWLRQPILLSPGSRAALTPTEQMAIKVFAKRVRESETAAPPESAQHVPPAPHATDPDLTYTLPAQFAEDSAIVEYLRNQLAHLPHTRGHDQDRAILALALDSERRPLGIARARNGLRRDAHAEWVLLQSLTSSARKQVAEIWTTLKPCRFCATLLYPYTQAHAQARPVTYLAHDPGPWGRATCLDTDAPDRLRFYPQDSAQRERLWETGDSSITSTNS